MNIRRLINESVQNAINENIRIQRMANIISESVTRKLFEADSDTDMKRNAVMKALKDPKYNHAQLAYALGLIWIKIQHVRFLLRWQTVLPTMTVLYVISVMKILTHFIK